MQPGGEGYVRGEMKQYPDSVCTELYLGGTPASGLVNRASLCMLIYVYCFAQGGWNTLI